MGNPGEKEEFEMVRCVAIVAAAVGAVCLCGLTHAQGSASGSVGDLQ